MEGCDLLLDGLDICDDSEEKRSVCNACERPQRVCWCPHLPNPPVQVKHKVIILQHPNECKRAIRTARMLELGLEEDCCKVVKARKFPGQNTWLEGVLSAPNTYILYPGDQALDISEMDGGNQVNLLVLDGTWDQAKKMFVRNPSLQNLPQLKLCLSTKSEYVVRTQPSEGCLSTLESVAHCLANLEKRPDIVERLLMPLQALCNVQINHGAVNHDSKEFKSENMKFTKSHLCDMCDFKADRKRLLQEHINKCHESIK